jgi:hypothetical protein
MTSPSTKVTAATLAAAVSTIIFALIDWLTTVEVPLAVSGAVTTVLALILGYFIPETNPAPSQTLAERYMSSPPSP